MYCSLTVRCHFMYWVVICILGNLYFNSDGETFISADDLRINLWNLEISNQSFNIIDVKPTNMEDLTGITSKPTNYLLSVLIMCVIGHRCERKYTLSEVDFFIFFYLISEQCDLYFTKSRPHFVCTAHVCTVLSYDDNIIFLLLNKERLEFRGRGIYLAAS